MRTMTKPACDDELPDGEEWVAIQVHVSTAALISGILTPGDIALAAQDYANETGGSDA